MAENDTKEDSGPDTGPDPFEKLKTAIDHEDRAQRLRAEAKRETLDKVAGITPFEADVAVNLRGNAFEVTCVPKELRDDIEDEFDEQVKVATPIRFTIGELPERERVKNLKQVITEIESEYDEGAPVDVVLGRAREIGMNASKAEHEIEKLKQKGEVYEPSTDHLRTT